MLAGCLGTLPRATEVGLSGGSSNAMLAGFFKVLPSGREFRISDPNPDLSSRAAGLDFPLRVWTFLRSTLHCTE